MCTLRRQDLTDEVLCTTLNPLDHDCSTMTFVQFFRRLVCLVGHPLLPELYACV
jgi:hypothetical protein